MYIFQQFQVPLCSAIQILIVSLLIERNEIHVHENVKPFFGTPVRIRF